MRTEPRVERVYAPDLERQIAALETLLLGDLADLLAQSEPLIGGRTDQSGGDHAEPTEAETNAARVARPAGRAGGAG
jgi:hypothetical protein